MLLAAGVPLAPYVTIEDNSALDAPGVSLGYTGFKLVAGFEINACDTMAGTRSNQTRWGECDGSVL